MFSSKRCDFYQGLFCEFYMINVLWKIIHLLMHTEVKGGLQQLIAFWLTGTEEEVVPSALRYINLTRSRPWSKSIISR